MSSAAPYPAVLVGRTGSAVPAARALTPSWLAQVIAGTHALIEAHNATNELHARGELVRARPCPPAPHFALITNHPPSRRDGHGPLPSPPLLPLPMPRYPRHPGVAADNADAEARAATHAASTARVVPRCADVTPGMPAPSPSPARAKPCPACTQPCTHTRDTPAPNLVQRWRRGAGGSARPFWP